MAHLGGQFATPGKKPPLIGHVFGPFSLLLISTVDSAIPRRVALGMPQGHEAGIKAVAAFLPWPLLQLCLQFLLEFLPGFSQ